MVKTLLNMDHDQERLDLTDLAISDIASLECMFDQETPDTWRDLARSHFLTLRSYMPDYDEQGLAALAMLLTKGIAADLGGTQPYITAGSQLLASARARRVIELRQRGMPYREVAKLCEITEARVRQIENEWVREQRAARQGALDLT